MKAAKLRKPSRSERSGAAILIMVLLVIVLCALIWLNPMALMSGSGSGMPWNEESRLVRADEKVQQPNQQQPKILDNLCFEAQIAEDGDVRGGVSVYILTDGRIKGVWGGAYRPNPELTWEVVGAHFEGNIDPSKIYSSEGVEDPTKLYFIGKGRFIILETNSKNNRVKKASGNIYVTGWLDNEYNAVGKVTITSDKKNYTEYGWQGKGAKARRIPDFKPSPLGL
jgi:hypothetical protein